MTQNPGRLLIIVGQVIAGIGVVWLLSPSSSTVDEPALTRWTFYVTRNDKWFAASYFIAAAYDEMPSMARRYLESVRFDGEA